PVLPKQAVIAVCRAGGSSRQGVGGGGDRVRASTRQGIGGDGEGRGGGIRGRQNGTHRYFNCALPNRRGSGRARSRRDHHAREPSSSNCRCANPRRMTIEQSRGYMSAETVKKIAASAFTDAIEMLAIIEVLEAGNLKTTKALNEAGAGRAAMHI